MQITYLPVEGATTSQKPSCEYFKLLFKGIMQCKDTWEYILLFLRPTNLYNIHQYFVEVACLAISCSLNRINKNIYMLSLARRDDAYI